ncbi:MAG TPA: ABC transporter permease subunit [Caproiciproducens sp.]|nr:ABC transporter permease subunit [Caproiciproducens sp.]
MKRKTFSALGILLLCAYLILPLALTFFYSVFQQWTDILPSGFTLQYFQQVFTDTRFLVSLGRTVMISVLPVVLCTLIVLLAMYVVVVHLPGLDRVMQVLCMIPYAIQGIILAVSILSLYVDAPEPFSDRLFMLTAAYCVMILPYMYQSIKNSLNSVNAPRLLETALILGAGRMRAFFSIIVPNIISGIAISMMLSVSMVFGDFVVVNTIGGSYFETAQMYLYKMLAVSGQFSSALIVVLFLTTLILSGAMIGLKNRKKNSER